MKPGERHRIRATGSWGEHRLWHCICTSCKERRRWIREMWIAEARWPAHAGAQIREHANVLDALTESGKNSSSGVQSVLEEVR